MQINVDGYGEQKTYAGSSFFSENAKFFVYAWIRLLGRFLVL